MTANYETEQKELLDAEQTKADICFTAVGLSTIPTKTELRAARGKTTCKRKSSFLLERLRSAPRIARLRRVLLSIRGKALRRREALRHEIHHLRLDENVGIVADAQIRP